MSTACGRRHCQ
jgi:predicted HicB family RNase H-like nuclease